MNVYVEPTEPEVDEMFLNTLPEDSMGILTKVPDYVNARVGHPVIKI